MPLLLTVLLFILMINSSFVLAQKDTIKESKIQWFTDDKNELPYLFTDIPHSLAVDTNNQVLRQVNNVKFDIKVAQIPRINQLLKTEQAVCVGNRIKTQERIKFNAFSLPIHIYPGLRLYYIPENSPLPKEVLNKDGALLSLNALFSALPNHKIGIVQQRSYGQFLDKELSKQQHKNLLVRSGGSQYSAMISMLFTGRIDFILEYPTVVFEELNISGVNKTISSIAIAGNPEHILSHFACSKTSQGYKFIQQINKIVRQQYQTPAFYQAHTRYLSYFELASFDNTYRTVFNTEPPK